MRSLPARIVLAVCMLPAMVLGFGAGVGCSQCLALAGCDEGDTELRVDEGCPDGAECYVDEACGDEVECVDLGEKHTDPS